MNSINSISVVYLMWVPYGVNYLKSFIESYCTYKPGADHQLVIVFKGFKDESELDILKQYLVSRQIVYKSLYTQDGLDIDSYLFAAKESDNNSCLFLNTNSVILSDNWLKKYADSFSYEKTGIISATASYQSYYSSVFVNNKWQCEFRKGLKYNFSKYKLLLKALFYWRFLFRPFPNPHARTNAFMIRRDVFLKLQKPEIKNKIDAYQFESGRNSLTNQLLKMKCEVLLVDRNGNTYTIPQWKTSNIFWQNNQENLLVADNQTMIYDKAPAEKKKQMTKLAWGN